MTRRADPGDARDAGTGNPCPAQMHREYGEPDQTYSLGIGEGMGWIYLLGEYLPGEKRQGVVIMLHEVLTQGMPGGSQRSLGAIAQHRGSGNAMRVGD